MNVDELRAHMRRHREILRSKFETVARIFGERLDGTGSPRGHGRTAATSTAAPAPWCAWPPGAGIAVAPARATPPYGSDPNDTVIRIGPTYR
ncbi:hypothetical protein [Streptomyces violaceusniger]|uniref:hypothetical protein n=1 Tax=Streptomyces violaceusniger TaxID=68280 RepID=UPI0031D03889